MTDLDVKSLKLDFNMLAVSNGPAKGASMNFDFGNAPFLNDDGVWPAEAAEIVGSGAKIMMITAAGALGIAVSFI